MPEQQPKKRTSNDVNAESVNLQLKAGGMQYIIRQNQKELEVVNDRLRDLSIEYHQLREKEAAEDAIRREIEAQVKASQKPIVVDQATTQPGSEAVSTPSPESPDGQGQKQE